MDVVYSSVPGTISRYLFDYVGTFSLPFNECCYEDKKLLDLIKRFINDDEDTEQEIKEEFHKKVMHELNRIKEIRNG